MLATPIFSRSCRSRATAPALLSLLWITLVILSQSLAAQTNVTTADLQRWADVRLAEARKRLATNSTQIDLRLKLAEAIFDRAEFAKDDDERETLAKEGIAVARQVIATDPKLAAAHHYLGMNMGQLARTKLLGAISLVDQMEAEFKTARALDATFDYAGPDRCLGLLYRDAPGWPTSIGSRSKAREHLRTAAELRPNHPENRLNLLESAFMWQDRPLAVLEYRALLQLMPAMPGAYPGSDWLPNRVDWSRRWTEAQARFRNSSRPVVSPRNTK
ncbi:MAG: hypothetical protein H7X97_00435 [Opitutaceae bacterium]|nr:hypothetical protein [Verrucomicrobiales bacterium]